MNWTYTPYVGILLATTLIAAICAFVISRRPKTAGVYSLILLMSIVAVSALASALEYASLSFVQKLIWVKIEYLCAVTIPTLFFLFSLDYSLRLGWIKMGYILLLSIFPALGLIATITNQYHHLIWQSISLSPTEANTILYQQGLGYYILLVYDYILALAGLILLIRSWIKFPLSYRRQINILLMGALFPIVGGILTLARVFPYPGLNIVPISFTATSVVIAAGMLANQLFDLVPISSDVLIDNMLDGVLVLDAFNHIANINPVASRLTPFLSKKSIGQPVDRVLGFWEDIQKHYGNAAEIRTEVLLNDEPLRYLDVHISSLYDRHKHFSGRLVTLRDSTERRKTETDLARNVEELKIINRISLIITGGLDMERTLKALYEQCSRVAPSDVFYVALYNPSSALVNIPLYYEKGKYLTGISRDIHDHPGLIGSVIKARRTLYLHNGHEQITQPVSPVEPTQNKPLMHSYIGIPLMVRDQVIGVMAVESQYANAYTPDHVRLLEKIAVQAAIAIENARLYAEEQRLAIIDELTGVYNYRGLLELGSREVERSKRFNRPLAALFFDIDDFRNLNNTYSHTAGNLVLKAVVSRCSSVLRSVDILTRFGGDEFVALLPETDLASAEGVARRLSQEIASVPIKTSYGDLNITISAGVTMLTQEIPDLAALIDNANRAERQAKLNLKKTRELG